MGKKQNPAVRAEPAGLDIATRAAVRIEAYSTIQFLAEDFAANYLARKFRLAPCVARTIAALANIGGRFA